MYYQRPSRLHYRIAQVASWVVSAFVFRRKILRNEIKGKKGPFVVIANHETALDFVNLIGMTARPMSFVISNSFFQSLSADGFLLEGVLQGKSVSVSVPIGDVPTLPFSPGKHLEVQQGCNIYRCVPKDGRLVMKFIHLLKAYYALNHPEA